MLWRAFLERKLSFLWRTMLVMVCFLHEEEFSLKKRRKCAGNERDVLRNL